MGRIDTGKMTVLPKDIYRFNVIKFNVFKILVTLGVVVHVFNTDAWEADECKFEVFLAYVMSSRIAKAM